METFQIQAILSARDRMSGVVEKATGSLNRMTTMSTQTAEKVMSAGKVMGVAMAGLGTASIAAAGKMNAMNAQFSQTFGKMEGKATQVVNNMGKEFNMVPSRIKPSFAKMTAMFKGLGMDTQTAMKKAEDATRLTADAAAFYDTSFEDANAALTSFIKGNYEGGEAIGLFANDTQMAQYAIKKGVVSSASAWQNLDEKTKQATRLEYAKNMMKMAGVTGQASREANGFENVMGNLKQGLTELLAALGQPFFDSFIAMANKAAQGMARLTNWLKQNPAVVKAVAAGLTVLVGTLVGFAAKTLYASTIAKALTSAIAFITSPVGLVVAGITALVTALVYFYNTNSKVKAVIDQVWNGIKAVFTTVFTVISTVIKTVWASVSTWFQQNQQTIKSVVSTVWNGLKAVIGGAIQVVSGIINSIWKPIANWFVSNQQTIKQVVQTAWGIVKGLIQGAITVASTVIQNLWKPIATWFTQNQTQIKSAVQGAWSIVKTLIDTTVKAVTSIIGGVWKSTMNWLVENQDLIKGTIQKVWSAIKAFIVPVVQGISKVITNIFGAIANFINENQGKIKAIINTAWSIIKTTVNTAIKAVQNIIKIVMGAINGDWKSVWNGIKGLVSVVWNAIKSLVRNGINLVKDVISVGMNAVKTLWSTGWNNIKSFVGGIWNGIKGAISSGMSTVCDSMRNLMGSLVNIVRDIYHSMVSAGKDIVTGIWNGIASGWNWLTNQVSDLANNLVNSVKRALKIHSPSRIFRDDVGYWITRGIGVGMEGQSGYLNKVSNRLAQDAMPSIPKVNLGADWTGVNSSVGATINHNVSDLNAQKQPAYINLSIGGREFKAFVDDISKQQGFQGNLNASFGI